MIRTPVLIWLALLHTALPGGAAQQPRQEGAITGRVVTSDGQPLVAADVAVIPLGGSIKSAREARTTDKGRFSFDGLAAAAYSVLVWDRDNMDFFADDQNDNFGGPRICRPGDFVEIAVTREKPGVITGRVTYPNGEPVVEAIVRAFRVRDSQGRRVPPPFISLLASGLHRKTDDRGVYRVWAVQPGSYVITVGGKPDHGFTLRAPEPTDYDGDAPTYYGDSAQGSPSVVTVAPGAEVSGIDIQYRGGAGHTISGTFSGKPADEVNHYEIHITSVATGAQPSDYEIQQPGGRTSFTFSNLPDGDYDIAAVGELSTNQYETASQSVRVTLSGADLSGVTLVPITFASITGRFTLDSTDDRNRKPDCQSKTAPLLQESALIFTRNHQGPRPATPDNPHPSSIEIAVDSSGNFVVPKLEPGTYRLRPDLPGDTLYVSSITAPGPGSTTVPVYTTFSIKGGERLSPLVVSLRTGAAEFHGKVVSSTASATPRTGLRIHLVPIEPALADDRFRFAETSVKIDGAVTFTNIAPGRYRLLARPSSQSDNDHPLAETSEGRALLRRDARRSGVEIQLQPCQKLEEFELRYAAR